MVISFSVQLAGALEKIQWTNQQKSIPLDKNSSQKIELYGNAKWAVVDLLNERYAQRFDSRIDLYNWIYYNEQDEVAYFLNEAGSNILNYAQHKLPSAFHLWFGENGFVIAIEQEGNGFNALQIDQLRLRENEGAGFEFFRNCRSTIFFDNPQNAHIIYFMQTC